MVSISSLPAEQIYNVNEWSAGYFSINNTGQLVAHPHGQDDNRSIIMDELIEQFKDKDLTLPVLVRFTDILLHRVDRLINAFEQANSQKDYQGKYTAVYPIKVNQQRSVIEKLLSHDSGSVGLEAGSKPELLAILGVSIKPIRIICNGYKDTEFLRLATIGSQMGHDVCIVIEKLSELQNFLNNFDGNQAHPSLGIRIKLNAAAKGKWQNTGGEKGKFGFNASQLLQAIELLKHHNALSLFTLVHFHIGSQVANIRDIHNAVTECARHYAQIRQLGIDITTVDVGGGLGVDYEGSRSRSACSMNYSMEEYARNVVAAFADICQQHDLPQPDIISESGRAMSAHHAVLLTNVIECESAPGLSKLIPITEHETPVVQALIETTDTVNERSAVESYHNALHYVADAHQQYISGTLSLLAWAQIEQLYFILLRRVQSLLNPALRPHREIIDELNEKLADKMFCNFSLFQSLPDAWGIDQLFPIMPVSQMAEPLTQRVIVQDITCDSDGQIKQYIDGAGIESTLPLPKFKPEKPYHLAMFMVGAYQEILGDLHNLFGDTDSIHVELTPNGYQIGQIIKGESAEDVLKTVHFSKQHLLANYQSQLSQRNLAVEDVEQLMSELTLGITGYTYFEE